MLKIAEIAPEKLPVPPTKGGAVETVIYELSKKLCAEYEITVVSRPANSDLKDNIKYIGIPYDFISKRCEHIIQTVSRKNPIRILAKIHNVFLYTLKAALQLKNRYDIIHIHNDPNFVPLIKLFNNKSKIILHMHNNHLCVEGIFKRRYNRILMKIDTILCVSDYIKDQIIKKYPSAKNKCFTLYNGTDTKLFRPYRNNINNNIRKKLKINQNPMLLYVGRINKDKGVHILLESAHMLIKKIPNIKIVIVGSSWFKENHKSKYVQMLEKNSLDIKDNVIFTNYMFGKSLYYLFSAADIFICPSIWNDPSPLVLYESQSSGLPVIATNRGGCPEIIIDRKTGFLIKGNNALALSKKVEYLLNNKKTMKSFSIEARKLALSKFDWEIVAKNLSAYFKRLMVK